MEGVISGRLRRFAALDSEKRELKARLSIVEAEMKEIEPSLIESFAESGMQKATIDNTTYFLHRQLWASPKDGDYDRACDAFIAAGLGEFVQRRFHLGTVSAYFRELDAQGEAAVPAVEAAITVSEVYSLRSRKA